MAPGAAAVEGVVARGFVLGFCLLVDGEAVGELGAVVGEDGMDLEREVVEEAIKETGRDIGLEGPCRCRQQWMPLRGQLGVEAAPHGFENVVERQGEAAPQRDDQAFLPCRHRGGQPLRAGGTVGDILAASPARHGAAVDAELTGQRTVGGAALLKVSARARRSGGIGMQLEVHQRALPRSACRGVLALPRRSPRWVHKDLPRAAPPDAWRSRRRRAGPS
jgi:hypothetical protein